MGWKYYQLAVDDPKAKKLLSDNLRVCAFDHEFTRKLLARFSTASGPMFAIALDLLDLDSLQSYSYATFGGGKRWEVVTGTGILKEGERPIDGLIEFLGNYLLSTKSAVVLTEEWVNRKDLMDWRLTGSRTVSYMNDAYHMLTPTDCDPEKIESAVSTTGHWQTGVCSSYEGILQGDLVSEEFLDVIVAKTVHIFTAAFDGEGYLVWTPLDPRI